jgi:hypothetical protein
MDENKSIWDAIIATLKTYSDFEFLETYVGDIDEFEKMIEEIPQPDEKSFEIARKRLLNTIKDYKGRDYVE